MLTVIETILNQTSDLLKSPDFAERHKKTKTSFTRNRTLGFQNIIAICLNFPKKTLQLELNSFFELINKEKSVSKQGFSKQRQLISPSAFQELFNLTVQVVMKKKAIKTYKKHRFFAIDGTELQIPKTPDTVKKFTLNRGSTSPRARVSTLCDVLSGFVIHAEMDDLLVDERTLAKRNLEYFFQYKKKNDVVIFDRGYPSKAMVDFLHKNKVKYIIRYQKNHNKMIDTCDKNDFEVVIDGHRFRVIKLILDSGEIEILITNLGKSAFLFHEFKELYHLRWAIETKYDTLKNKLEIETFSGKTVMSIFQDFYVTLYMANISSSIKLVTDSKIIEEIERKKAKGKVYKHDYKTNENILIGSLKNAYISAVYFDSVAKRSLWLENFVKKAVKWKVASPPYRSFERPVSSHKRVTEKPKKAL